MTRPLTYADLPWHLAEPFELWEYAPEMGLLLLRHLGPYPVVS